MPVEVSLMTWCAPGHGGDANSCPLLCISGFILHLFFPAAFSLHTSKHIEDARTLRCLNNRFIVVFHRFIIGLTGPNNTSNFCLAAMRRRLSLYGLTYPARVHVMPEATRSLGRRASFCRSRLCSSDGRLAERNLRSSLPCAHFCVSCSGVPPL